MTGQMITATDDPQGAALLLIFYCQGCRNSAHSASYSGDDLIEIRKRVHDAGWRQRGGDWFKDECVPKGTDNNG